MYIGIGTIVLIVIIVLIILMLRRRLPNVVALREPGPRCEEDVAVSCPVAVSA